MTWIGRIARNASFTLTAQVVSRLLRMFYLILLARQLSAADFGFYNFGFSLALILTSLSNLGLETMIVREVVRCQERASSYLGSALLFKALLSLPIVGVLALLGIWLDYSAPRQVALLLIGLGLVLRELVELLMGIIRAHQRMEWEIALTAAEGVLLLASFALAVLARAGFTGLFVAYALTYVGQALLALALVSWRFVRPAISRVALWRQMRDDLALLRASAPVGVANFAGVLNNNGATLLMPFIRDEVETGIYGAAFSLVKGFLLLPRSLGIAALPVFSRLYLSSRESLRAAFERAFKVAWVGILPVSIATWALAAPIIRLLYDARYESAAAPLRFLGLSFTAMLLNTLCANLLIAADEQRIASVARTISIALNLVLLLVLTPLRGAVGAALALLISHTLLLALVIYAIQTRVCACRWGEILVKPTLAGIACLLALYALDRWSLWLAAPAAAAVYVAALVALRVIGASEWALIVAAWRSMGRWRRRAPASPPDVGP